MAALVRRQARVNNGPTINAAHCSTSSAVPAAVPSKLHPASKGPHSSVFLVLFRCRASGEMQPSSSVLQELATSLLPPPRAAGRGGAGQTTGQQHSSGARASTKRLVAWGLLPKPA